jgi:hypothetical protein
MWHMMYVQLQFNFFVLLPNLYHYHYYYHYHIIITRATAMTMPPNVNHTKAANNNGTSHVCNANWHLVPLNKKFFLFLLTLTVTHPSVYRLILTSSRGSHKG